MEHFNETFDRMMLLVLTRFCQRNISRIFSRRNWFFVNPGCRSIPRTVSRSIDNCSKVTRPFDTF